jgi:hypothetical protein
MKVLTIFFVLIKRETGTFRSKQEELSGPATGAGSLRLLAKRPKKAASSKALLFFVRILSVRRNISGKLIRDFNVNIKSE